MCLRGWWLCRYAIVFLSSEDTKTALYNLHMTLIPTYFIVGAGVVAIVNVVAVTMFVYVLGFVSARRCLVATSSCA